MTFPIAFLTDYGYEDSFTGACRLVIERLAPGTAIHDLTHGIPLADVRRGALALESAVMKSGPAVYLCVVDPVVGTEARGIAVRAADGSLFVGRDNGLFTLALDLLGGASEAADVSESPLRLEPVSPTFHGRDVFAPVAAHLGSGGALGEAGPSIDPSTLIRLDLPAAVQDGDGLAAPVLYADGFGNLILSATEDDLDFDAGSRRPLTVTVPGGRSYEAISGSTFADGAGGLVLYRASAGRLALGLDRGNAREMLGVGRDDRLRIRRR